MARDLLDVMRDSISGAVRGNRIGVAFSGGVDSALVSRVCADMGYAVELLTVGFSGSHDIEFAAKTGRLMGMPHHSLEIVPAEFGPTAARMEGIIGAQNLSWLENCIAFYYVSRLAKGRGLDTVVTANGIDELFCGYDAYRRAMPCDDHTIMQMTDKKIENELSMMDAINSALSGCGVRLVQPLLSESFVRHARIMPVSEKITGPDDYTRKHAIRALASRVGVPAISHTKRKKAFQYGSRIHKELLKIRRAGVPASGRPGRRP